MSGRLVILSPATEDTAEPPSTSPRSHRVERFRMATLANGKPNARYLIDGVLVGLETHARVKSTGSYDKPGASLGLTEDVLHEISARHDLVLNGVGD
jgi:hypothetical protein